jgi:general secretion pathway protein G
MKRCKRSMFTLVEILVVLAIIGLVAGLVLPNVIGHLQGANRKAAKAQIKIIDDSVITYYLDMKAYPSSLDDLVKNPGSSAKWGGPYMKDGVVPKDPWGNEYHFDIPGQENRNYDIYSYASDNSSGGTGADADVGSWYQEDE